MQLYLKKYGVIIQLFIVSLASCTGKDNSASRNYLSSGETNLLIDSLESNSFLEYFCQIPVLDSGLSYSNFDSIKKYKNPSQFLPKKAELIGTYGTNKEAYYILYTHPDHPTTPIWAVFNQAGLLLDEIELLDTEWLSIDNENLFSKFTLLDQNSILRENYIIEGADSILVLRRLIWEENFTLH